ncbi:MAG: NAD(P)-dependent glycerol-3-phosphate dehydrogenase [Planctomycetes bacterium]|nr:NAD(P)-dependent glycerol-3-phosphate dehydrogenase [Planctomycetota bacterium]
MQSGDQPHKRRYAIIGTGQMGLLSGIILASQDIESVLWGRRPEHVAELIQLRESARHLPGHRIPDQVLVTADERGVFDGVDVIVNAVPTQYIRPIYTRLREHIPVGIPIVSMAKGIENETLLRPTQIIADVLQDDPDRPARPLASLCGPSIAAEMAGCKPATMIAASDDEQFAITLQQDFSTSWLRIYTNADLLGVELAGATKNVIAIAAGIVDGLTAGYNAKSALLARGLAEITRLGLAMGASSETFFGLAGIGDLATTCFCPLGRNRTCGEELGKGKKLADILASTESVVEGVPTTKSVMQLAAKYRVEMPITRSGERGAV